MTPEALLDSCEQAGVFLRLDNGKVKAYGREAVIAQFLPILKAHKEELKAFLASEEHEFFEERAAMLEFGGGLSRKEAEAQASQELKSRLNRHTIH